MQSVDVGPTATSHTLTGLQTGATYSISIVTLSNQLPSAVLGPVTVTLSGELVGIMSCVIAHLVCHVMGYIHELFASG